MLELKNITKDYATGDLTVHALKGISLQFRKNEMVAILGQSGCGKTTMLNIIGGLDHYTSGDLVIDGTSTKNYKDRDWDNYRNHSIGFVFQSYNLIPHQTVLQNVELALTISGVGKAERRERAKKALEAVGLGNQLKKRPSEMSGGQMQRVAIARALVNDPNIILADEPTGALDSETSLQVMDILKEVAKDRLVIMVTHNPELAEQYATRIIRMKDGVILSDSMPLTEEEIRTEQAADQAAVAERKQKRKKHKKASMSLGTAFGLSLKNLFTKKGRTLLTTFAGSIGIIGIALIYAVSNGATTYIDAVQEDTLSSYPLTLEASTVDISDLMTTFMGTSKEDTDHDKDKVYSQSVMYDMINALNNLESTENDLASFKKYLEEKLDAKDGDSELIDAVSGIQYSYDTDMTVYTENLDGEIVLSDTQELLMEAIKDNMGIDLSGMESLSESYSMSSMMGMSGSSELWEEMLSGDGDELINPLIKEQYDLVYGSWPDAYDEIVIVLDENNELADLTLYALGLESYDDIKAVFNAVSDQTEIDTSEKSWTYEEICEGSYHVVLNADCYVYNEETGNYEDLRDTDTGARYLYDNGLQLKVTGIIRPNPDSVSSMLNGSIGYTKALTEYIVEKAKDSDALKAQLADPDTDIFTGLPFKPDEEDMTAEQKATEFKAYVENMDIDQLAATYTKILTTLSEEELQAMVDQTIGSMSREDMVTAMLQAMSGQMAMDESEITAYLANMSDEELQSYFRQMTEQQLTAQYANEVMGQLAGMSNEDLAAAFTQAMGSYTTDELSEYYDSIMEFSDSTYEDNLAALNDVDLDNPSAINLYASSFANKDIIEDAIAEYNDSVDELSEIHYTDYVGLMMSSITTIINVITYILIAFVAISLVVSSIMIGVITLISVQERTKEIGILRAIGASKANVSSMFNAETLIIGFFSGLFGVVITALLCLPINALIRHLSGINNIQATLPIPTAIILVVISMLLTLIAGIIPSKSAAKKDPVVALRTE